MSVSDPNVPVPDQPPVQSTPTPEQPTQPEQKPTNPDGSEMQAFYCPGCGRQVGYMKECTGKPEAPHPPIEVVSTDELSSNDPSQHTPAPSTENLG